MNTENKFKELFDTVKIPSPREVEAAGQRFDRRLRRERIRRRVIRGVSSAAAVILLGVLITSLWTKDEKHEAPESPRMVKVEHKITAPTLILANGNNVGLNEGKVNQTINESNIRVDNNHIVYDSVSDLQEIVYNELIIPAGYTYNITLADGTRVMLNAGSRLKYPVEFIGATREVELSGEAFFDVTRSDKPFEVKASGSKIRVYGTRFNVKITRQMTVETVLVEGKIGFQPTDETNEIDVSPGEKVSYDAKSGQVEVRQADTGYATAWMDGVFRYQDKKLNLILEDISAWHGVEFELQTDISQIEITMSLSKKTSTEEVISFLELMTNCKFTKERGHYIIEK